MKKKNIIFDFDGVIADSEFFQLKIWDEVLRELGYDVGELPISAIAGIADELAIRNLLPAQSPAIYKKLVFEKKQRCQRQKLDIEPVRGIDEFLAFHQTEKSFSICSNSPASEIKEFTERHFPSIAFQKILGKGDFSKEKPDPAPYLKLIEITGILPDESVVVEDSVAGVKAARAAGLHVIYLDRYGIAIPNVQSVSSIRGIRETGII
ncbi:MAG: HAD family phosphatase [Calditrichaeota bacterium]|nr:MAG: HAD family phosphatase [Calditrichota bacterium]